LLVTWQWTCGASDEASTKLYAFVHAATWDDDFEMKQGCINELLCFYVGEALGWLLSAHH
jgi:hypothetical protein